ncbi:MAG: hypothetical protein LBB25_04195 [Holosporaceae bacterium]|jgi:hypothetical protein|nr:hypothetical protein [Holosporaceae bacterium]
MVVDESGGIAGPEVLKPIKKAKYTSKLGETKSVRWQGNKIPDIDSRLMIRYAGITMRSLAMGKRYYEKIIFVSKNNVIFAGAFGDDIFWRKCHH